MNLTSQGKEA